MILALFIVGPILLICLCAYCWRRKALQSASQAQGMALYAARLEGRLEESQKHNDWMSEIAREAIRASASDVGLDPDEVLPYDIQEKYRRINSEIAANARDLYVPPVVKFCVCNVSVRHDDWPQPCPACGMMIGDDVLNADLIE